MTDLVSTAGVIWEKCLNFKQCVKIGWPINKEICIGVGACLRLIEKGGTIVLQIDAAGQHFEYNLGNACHPIYTVAIGKIEICIEKQPGQTVRLQARACIGYGPINKCWDIWGTDIHWLTAAEFAALDLAPLGLSHDVLARLAQAPDASVAFEDEFQPLAPCPCSD
ncbi:hypothetical protein [Sphingobium sp. CAP-1]|uniref:hypothetical protein n=1 Tax=Sphingobium sp. CAP-1 TaxID=2676077 RepID=UPI0012BB23B4|nr:hypothetical protein [Sphingobium sp. CAP-1]QGP78030.1 hypothetical protein GL174_02700 [Sphingobium sp. CAP-1]